MSEAADAHSRVLSPKERTMADRVRELLTPDNCVVTLIDHQPQMLFGVANFDRQTVINNTVGLRLRRVRSADRCCGRPVPDDQAVPG